MCGPLDPFGLDVLACVGSANRAELSVVLVGNEVAGVKVQFDRQRVGDRYRPLAEQAGVV